MKRLYVALIIGTWGTDALAYLDPGTGSMLLQGLLATIAGGIFFIRNKWAWFKSLFRKLIGSRTDDKVE